MLDPGAMDASVTSGTEANDGTAPFRLSVIAPALPLSVSRLDAHGRLLEIDVPFHAAQLPVAAT
jgi:hypothetical protein